MMFAPPSDTAHTPATGASLARTLLAVCALLILYGSLYPFDYMEPPSAAAAWRQLLLASEWWTSPGDVMGNVLLFVPWGALGATALPRPRGQRLVWFFVGSVVFAFAVQVIQIWFPSREPSRADVLWNAVGTLTGMAFAGALARLLRLMDQGVEAQARPALGLLVLWVTTQWAPLIPTIDWQAIKDSLKPLLLHPELDSCATLLALARVLAVGCMLQALGGTRRWIAPAFAAMLSVVLAGKLVIVGQSVMPSNVIGYIGGYACWLLLRGRDEPRRLIATMAVLFVAYVLHALTPFAWRSAPAHIHLLPFAALLEGSMELNARALLDAGFLYGALLWLAQRSSGRVIGISIALALCVLALEVVQLWIEGRTGDITEPLLVLFASVLLQMTQSPPRIEHRETLGRDARPVRHARRRQTH